MRVEYRHMKNNPLPPSSVKEGKKWQQNIHINSQSSTESQHQMQGIYIKPFTTLWTRLMAFVWSSLAPECPGRKWSECAMLSLQDMWLDRVLASAGFIFFSDPELHKCIIVCFCATPGKLEQFHKLYGWKDGMHHPTKMHSFFPSSPPTRLLKKGKTWSSL